MPYIHTDENPYQNVIPHLEYEIEIKNRCLSDFPPPIRNSVHAEIKTLRKTIKIMQRYAEEFERARGL